ncbi:MAG: thymidylate synthase [Methanomicrobiales archaeon]|jgi:thymidylate synthase|nr:thymidylate synthase [Methanomicrobiales archaeon]
MRVIRAPNLARAHELAVKAVLERGVVITSEDGEATIEHGELGIRVDTPLITPMFSPSSRFQRGFMEQYAHDLLHGSQGTFEYDYHGRLFHWGDGLVQKGEVLALDQIQYIIRKLTESPESRRALALVWNPPVDEDLAHCPCLQLVQCTVRDRALHMKVVFRSNDMLTAAGANMFALVHLQQHIAMSLGRPCGSYTHISLVPHIYFRRDITDIPPFCMDGERIRPLKEVCSVCTKCPRG